jgi:hypothetical protein
VLPPAPRQALEPASRALRELREQRRCAPAARPGGRCAAGAQLPEERRPRGDDRRRRQGAFGARGRAPRAHREGRVRRRESGGRADRARRTGAGNRELVRAPLRPRRAPRGRGEGLQADGAKRGAARAGDRARTAAAIHPGGRFRAVESGGATPWPSSRPWRTYRCPSGSSTCPC